MLHCPRSLMRTVAYSGMFLVTSIMPVFAADPTGDWKVADGVANIRVAECNGGMWGAVAWEKTPGGRDKNNPDVSKQNRPTLGMPILIDMKKKPGVDAWEGQVYNAKDGQFYSSTIKPRQQHGKGRAEDHRCGPQDRRADNAGRRAEDHWRRQPRSQAIRPKTGD